MVRGLWRSCPSPSGVCTESSVDTPGKLPHRARHTEALCSGEFSGTRRGNKDRAGRRGLACGPAAMWGVNCRDSGWTWETHEKAETETWLQILDCLFYRCGN